MNPYLYALLCVAVPLAWGIFVVSVSNRIERAVQRKTKRPPRVTAPRYHI
jgi:hypothetical protein